MNKSVVIVGASGHGKVVADIVLKNKDNIVGFLDDNTELAESFAGFPVLGTTDQYQKYSDAWFVIAIGNAAVREKLVDELKNVSWYTAIHPTAVISELDANIGEGTVIMANAVVNAGARIEQMIYVGDNVEKDFQAPKQLGMRSIFFKNKDGLYQGENIDDIQMIDRILKLNL